MINLIENVVDRFEIIEKIVTKIWFFLTNDQFWTTKYNIVDEIIENFDNIYFKNIRQQTIKNRVKKFVIIKNIQKNWENKTIDWKYIIFD